MKVENIFNGKTLKIPVDFLYDEYNSTISWNERKVYLFILAFKEKNKKNPARADFDRHIGLTYNTVRRIINRLQELNFLTVNKRYNKGGKSNIANEYILRAW